MNNRQRRFWTGVLALTAGVWLAGCACPYKNVGTVCKVNEDRGLATIKCQPVDVEVAQGDTAVFAVDAKGKELIYQWYFRGESGVADVVGSGTTGGRTAQLTVSDVQPPKGGFYYCEIDSTSPLGPPVRTRTRDAHLGIKAEVEPSTGGIQVYPPQQASMPPGSSGNVCGSTYCGYVSYQNGGAGFDPDPGTTKGLAKVRVGTVYRNNNTFHLKWFDNTGGTGCALNSATDPQQKDFTINPSKIYFFTVYFKTPCPAQGSQLYFELSFVP